MVAPLAALMVGVAALEVKLNIVLSFFCASAGPKPLDCGVA